MDGIDLSLQRRLYMRRVQENRKERNVNGLTGVILMVATSTEPCRHPSGSSVRGIVL